MRPQKSWMGPCACVIHAPLPPRGVAAERARSGSEIRRRCAPQNDRKGLVILSAGSDVLRFVPPLVITKDDIDEMCDKLGRVLERM